VISVVDNNLTALLSLALDAAQMRQQAIAQNIANVNTPGYRRVSVSFEQRIAQLTRDGTGGAAQMPSYLSYYRPKIEYATGVEGPVQLDQELADMSETVLHHQALLKALNKQLELIGLAINEGKR
jgi:flagellar basal-body rod protein FlgB